MADVDDHTEAAKKPAETVASDLLLEIFGRVPSDDRNQQFKLASKHLISLASECCSIFQLRLVSRRWNSLIFNNFPRIPKPFPAAGLIFDCGPTSSYRFTPAAHSSYILFLDQSIITTAPFKKINHDTWHGRSKVVHSCNGLLLCASKRKRDRDVYSVCNPTTGAHSTLPQVPRAGRQTVCGVYLAFDPRKSPHFKVVCVLGLDQAGCKYCRHCQFVVYSSETGSWGECGELFETNNVRFRNSNNNNNKNNGVYWNGAIHWVGSSQLICFNPDADNRLAPPKVMPLPIARNHDRYYFGESYGHLHYIGLNEGVREVVVHEMSSDCSAGWVVKFKFDVSNAVRYYLDYYDYFNVFAVVRGERDEDTFLVLGTSRWRPDGWKKIIWFNHNATYETIFNFYASEKLLQNPGEFTYPFQYIESLAAV